jgi:hypothetical protein
MTIERGDNLGPALPDPQPEPEETPLADPFEPSDPFGLGIGATLRGDL